MFILVYLLSHLLVLWVILQSLELVHSGREKGSAIS